MSSEATHDEEIATFRYAMLGSVRVLVVLGLGVHIETRRSRKHAVSGCLHPYLGDTWAHVARTAQHTAVALHTVRLAVPGHRARQVLGQ